MTDLKKLKELAETGRGAVTWPNEVILALIARIEELEGALSFYADIENWIPCDEKTFSAIREKTFPIGDSDATYISQLGKYVGGRRARAVMKGADRD